MNVKNNKVLLIFGKPTIVEGILCLLKHQDFKMMEIGRSPENVYNYLQEHNFDPVIINIQDKAQKLDESPALFIGTASKHSSQNRSELECLDFYLNQNPASKEKDVCALFKETIFVKNDCTYEKVKLSEILWVEAHGAYCQLNTTKKALLLCINLSAFQKRVEIPYLVRVHRSYIINLHKIDAFETNYIHIDGKLIPLGSKYKNCFEKVFPYLGKAGIII